MILSTLRDLIATHATDALKASGKEAAIPAFDLSTPPPRVPGDLAANVALMVAKAVGLPPRTLAESIAARLTGHPLVAKAEIAGSGFVNVWLSDAALGGELLSLISEHKAPPVTGPKTLVEFVSANPTGPLHVGHGRGAALGDSLVRIHRYLGHDVTAEFYVNDAGGQIRKLGLSVETRMKELKGETVTMPEGGYMGSYVIDIAKELIETHANLKSVEPTQTVFSEGDMAGYASAKILKTIQETLKNFGVHFDTWYSETSLHKKGTVMKLIAELKEKGFVYDADGATWFKATEFGDEKDRVLQKTNEAPTYFASDIAYHEDKFDRGFKKLVNIWGADHHGYSQRLKGAMKALGRDGDDIQVIFNQMVSIKGGRMSKRAGDAISLQEVTDDVGRDATRFFFALRSPGAHFEFDLDLAKKQASDNPVFYVQYVHARCCSIFKEAEKKGFSTDTRAWKTGQMPAITPEEKTVLMHLASFDRTVELCAKDGSNHHLTVYLQDLAGKYHSFYEKCFVLVDDAAQRSFRLGLVDAIRRRVAQGLDLLGVSAPESL